MSRPDRQRDDDKCIDGRIHDRTPPEQKSEPYAANGFGDKRNASAHIAQVLPLKPRRERMSIRKMIALHPDVAGHVNQPLGDAAHHLMYCARMCLSCADACAAEKMDMRAVHPHLPRLRGRLRSGGQAGGAPDRIERAGAARNARAMRPGLRRMRGRVREARPRALQAVRADVPGMRGGLPQRGGVRIG